MHLLEILQALVPEETAERCFCSHRKFRVEAQRGEHIVWVVVYFFGSADLDRVSFSTTAFFFPLWEGRHVVHRGKARNLLDRSTSAQTSVQRKDMSYTVWGRFDKRLDDITFLSFRPTNEREKACLVEDYVCNHEVKRSMTEVIGILLFTV